jgi:hypothetical protein
LYRTGPLFAAVAVAMALASCGGGTTSTTGGRPNPPIPPVRTTTVGGVPAKAATNPDPDVAGCQDRLGEFVGRMDDLRQSLLAGLSYSEYVVRVRAIRDAYEAVPVERLGVGCLKGPASKAEDAFNQYLRAANAWGECAATAGCAASEIEGKLQDRWKLASKSLEAAEKQT